MRLLLVAMLASACGPKSSAQPAPLAAAPVETRRSPSLCPAGTRQIGAPPPDDIGFHCERSGGVKHGPYAYWYENGQMEEQGTYVDGMPRGRRTTWDETGKLIDQKEFGAPVTICVYDRSSRRALLRFPFSTITGPWNARTPMQFDQDGRLTLKLLPTGHYRIEWYEHRGRSRLRREFVVDSDHPQTIALEVDASWLAPSYLGGPSPCAPQR